MPTAPAADQLRLLDVQDADLRIQQAQHKRDNLPVLAEIADLEAQDSVLDEEAIARGAEVSDLTREVTKAEDDVQAVRTRADRGRERLASGSSNAKEMQALQSEMELLERRQADLEEVQLEAMERLEAAEQGQADVVAKRENLSKRLRELAHQRDTESRAIDEEIAATQAERAESVDGLDSGLLSLYERLRDAKGGIGAATLQGATCLGCHMTLNAADVNAIQDAPAEQITRCEECGRILVRKGNK